MHFTRTAVRLRCPPFRNRPQYRCEGRRFDEPRFVLPKTCTIHTTPPLESTRIDLKRGQLGRSFSRKQRENCVSSSPDRHSAKKKQKPIKTSRPVTSAENGRPKQRDEVIVRGGRLFICVPGIHQAPPPWAQHPHGRRFEPGGVGSAIGDTDRSPRCAREHCDGGPAARPSSARRLVSAGQSLAGRQSGECAPRESPEQREKYERNSSATVKVSGVGSSVGHLLLPVGYLRVLFPSLNPA